MKKIILGVDIDSCIYDAHELYSKAGEEIFGFGCKKEDLTHWYAFRDIYGEDFWEIFNHALHPSRIPERNLYPNVVEALTSLRDDMGIGIHFITMNVNPDLMRKPLKKWLTDNFGECGLSVTLTGDKVAILNRLNGFGIVEDKYETADKVHKAGMYSIVKRQPWNLAYEDDNPYIDFFDDWSEAKDLIAKEVSSYRFRSEANRRLSNMIEEDEKKIVSV